MDYFTFIWNVYFKQIFYFYFRAVKDIGLISKALLTLVGTNAISTENFLAGLKEILEFAPDLFIDIPLLYEKLGKIIAPQIEKKVCFIIVSVNYIIKILYYFQECFH